MWDIDPQKKDLETGARQAHQEAAELAAFQILYLADYSRGDRVTRVNLQDLRSRLKLTPLALAKRGRNLLWCLMFRRRRNMRHQKQTTYRAAEGER